MYLFEREKDSLSNLILKEFKGLLTCHGKFDPYAFIQRCFAQTWSHQGDVLFFLSQFSLFYQEFIYSSLFLPKIRITYLKYLNIFFSCWVCCMPNSNHSCRKKQHQGMHFHINLRNEKDQTPKMEQNKICWKQNKWARRCYYPLPYFFFFFFFLIESAWAWVLDAIQSSLLQQV